MNEEPSEVAPKSRLEVNFLRLFKETQRKAMQGVEGDSWTYGTNVQWLSERIPELESSPCCPDADVLNSYKRRVQQLQAVMQAHQASSTDPTRSPSLGRGSPKQSPGADPQPAPEAPTRLPAPPPTIGDPLNLAPQATISRRIHHSTIAKLTTTARNQLMGSGVDELNPDEEISTYDMDDRLRNDEKQRDAMLEEMIAMTRQWKQQSSAANYSIKKDIQVLDKNNTVADTNQSKLGTEAARLSEFNARACNCWIWLVLLVVCCVFVSMVLLIRIFPKR